MPIDQLTRKANGFLTKSGQFFDKKSDADAYEAIEDFNRILHDMFAKFKFPPMLEEWLTDHIRYLLLANKPILQRYLKLVTSLPEEPSEYDIRAPVATGPVAPEPIELIDTPLEDIIETDYDGPLDTETLSPIPETVGNDDGEGTTSGNNATEGFVGVSSESL